MKTNMMPNGLLASTIWESLKETLEELGKPRETIIHVKHEIG